ncbi:hypothetical protein QLX08_009213 [Tetragonisca angustula]|uniref:Envelope protein n=1 Tax=Tetragonisca angustula TaxID=166442 RepID=A0AAW0ZIB6_9HYME
MGTAYDVITARMKNLERSVFKLKTITRRRLLNAIGSISKTLFGTLDDADLELINRNIDKLFDDQNKLTHIVQNQTSMFKLLQDDYFQKLTGQVKIQLENLKQIKNDLLLDRNLLILEALITELTNKVNDFYLTIILGKRGIIDTTLIDIHTFMESYTRLTKDQPRFVINGNIGNFQHIIDISRLQASIINDTLIYQIIVPMLESDEWTLFRHIAIPHKIQESFIAPLIEHEYTLEIGGYIPIDQAYITKYCRESPIGKLCERTQPTQHLNSKMYNPIENCKNTVFR